MEVMKELTEGLATRKGSAEEMIKMIPSIWKFGVYLYTYAFIPFAL